MGHVVVGRAERGRLTQSAAAPTDTRAAGGIRLRASPAFFRLARKNGNGKSSNAAPGMDRTQK